MDESKCGFDTLWKELEHTSGVAKQSVVGIRAACMTVLIRIPQASNQKGKAAMIRELRRSLSASYCVLPPALEKFIKAV